MYLVLRLGWASMTLLALSSFVVPYVDRLADHGKLLGARSQSGSKDKGRRANHASSPIARALDAFLNQCTVRPSQAVRLLQSFKSRAGSDNPRSPTTNRIDRNRPTQAGAQALVLALLRRRQRLDRAPPLGARHAPPPALPPLLRFLLLLLGIGPGRRGPGAAGDAGPAAALGVPLPLPVRGRADALGRYVDGGGYTLCRHALSC